MKTRALFLLLVFLPASLFADSLTEAIEKILSQKKYIAAVDTAEKSAEYDYLKARAALYPFVSLSTPFSWSDTLINKTESGGQTVDVEGNLIINPSVSVSASQLLPTGGTLSASLTGSYSRSDIDSVSPSVFSSVYDLDPVSSFGLGFSLSLSQPLFVKPFYSALKENLEHKEKSVNLSLLKEKNKIIRNFIADCFSVWSQIYNVEILQARYDSSLARAERFEREKALGLWTERQVLAAQVEARRAKLALDSGEAAMERLRSAFKARYGIDVPEFSGLPVWAAPKISFDTVLKKNPELLGLRATASDAKVARLSAQKDSAPSLSASVSADYSDTLDADLYSFSLSGSASVYITLYDAGAARASIGAAESLEKQAELNVSDYIVSLKSSYEELSYRLNSYQKQRELDEDMLRIAELELEAAEKELEGGHSTVSTVKEKALAVDTARMDMWSNLVSYNLAVLDMYILAGEDIAELFLKSVIAADK